MARHGKTKDRSRLRAATSCARRRAAGSCNRTSTFASDISSRIRVTDSFDRRRGRSPSAISLRRIAFSTTAGKHRFTTPCTSGIRTSKLTQSVSNTLNGATEQSHRPPRDAVAAEIGAAFGTFTAESWRSTSRGPCTSWICGAGSATGRAWKKIRGRFKAELDQERLHIHVGPSTEKVSQFPDGMFDWVYIDTNHEFRVTWHELLICNSKVKRNGYIAGHDFCTGNVADSVRMALSRRYQSSVSTMAGSMHI